MSGTIIRRFARRVPAGVFPLLLGALLLLPALGASQDLEGAGTTSTNLQKIGMGARGVAIGESFITVADDPTAIFWNPAGLVLSKGIGFSMTHSQWIAGVNHEALALSQNLGLGGTLGESFVYLGTGDFLGTLETPGGGYGGTGGVVNAAVYQGSLAYAERLGNLTGGDFFSRILVGAKGSVIGQRIAGDSAVGFSLDAGFLFEAVRDTFYLGGVAYSIGAPIEGFSQPFIFKGGASVRVRDLAVKSDCFILAVEGDRNRDTGFKAAVGGEYRIGFENDALALRGGYRGSDYLGEDYGFTMGVGISHRIKDADLGLDYAFVPYGLLGSTHRFSLSLVFDGTPGSPEVALSAVPAFTLEKETDRVETRVKSPAPIQNWRITIASASGAKVFTLSGKGNPPARFDWDGKTDSGAWVPQGNYVARATITDKNNLSGVSAPVTVAARLAPKEPTRKYVFQIASRVLFDSGRDKIKPSGVSALKALLRDIQKGYLVDTIVVEGHTDNVHLVKGSGFKNNLELSQARARTVMEYLIQCGVDPKQVSAVGYGSSRPIASNSTAKGRAKNRRVELSVSVLKENTGVGSIRQGIGLLKEKKYSKALEMFLGVLKDDPQDGHAHRLAGDCYYSIGEKAKAVKEYRMAVQHNIYYDRLRKWLQKYGENPNDPENPLPPSLESSEGQPVDKPAQDPAPKGI